MELMSSSEDEGDSPTSLSASLAHRKSSYPSTSQDSLDEELFRPLPRVHVNNRPTSASMRHKPVVSARQLLLGIKPSSEIRSNTKTDQDVASYSLKNPTVSTGAEKKELTAGERIALKYGLTAASKTPSRDIIQDRRLYNAKGSETSIIYDTGQDDVMERKDATLVTKKRSFWDAQTSGLDTKPSPPTYVSPFTNPDGYVTTKRRRLGQQQQQQLEPSQEEMNRARDAFYDDSTSGVQDFGARPRHVIGSAIPELDDAEDWMSDAKEIDSNQRLSGSRRVRKRIDKEQSDLSDDKKDVYTSEQWPQLDPPKVNAGPLVLSSSEEHKSTPFEVCAYLNSYLFDYQRKGVEFLFSAYERNTGAILGDDMGLGKTIQVIAFLSALLHKHGDARDIETWTALLQQRRERFSKSDVVGHPEDAGFCFSGEMAPILIVMPASLLQNWEQELHVWMSCKTIILRGKPSDRDALIDQIARGEYEVVICSYDILKMYLSRLHKIPWEVVVLDEMHCLKNPEARLTKAVKAIKCRKKLGLTGTLMQNNEKELHCLVDTIAPGAIGTWAEFSLYYGRDIKYGRKKSAASEAVKRSHQKEKELRHKLSPYYLRREKEINSTFQVVKKRDQVVFCDLTPLQMAAYKRVLAMPEFQLLQRGDERCDCGRDSKEKRKKCCYKTPADLGDGPGLLYERFHEHGPCKNCPNCMGLPCVAMLLKLSNHIELLKVNPHDRPEAQHYQGEFAKTAFGSDLEGLGGVNQVSSFQEMCALSTEACGKMIVLEKLLAVWRKRRERTLIFSRSTRMLDIIQLFLITKAIRYSRLDGNTKVEERLQMVNDFNSGDSNSTVFLISTRAGGVGLNLQSATNVVIFDPSWNPAHDCQAQDRAYRIGQTKDVHVYRLITLGTIEEMIYVRQIYKQQLSDTTLKGSNAPRYFEGVQGNPQQQGELFGIANLICWKPGGVLKGIQDAYQRGLDGLIVQQNRVRYDAPAMKKVVKKSAVKTRPNGVDDDEGEMIEVAGELVSRMVASDDLQALSPVEKDFAESSGSGEDDNDALNGATTFRHEEIVGEHKDKEESCRQKGTAVACSESESEVGAEVEAEVEAEGEAEFKIGTCCRTGDTSAASDQQASPLRSVPEKKSSLLSRMKEAKRLHDGAVGSDTAKRIYVPAYL